MSYLSETMCILIIVTLSEYFLHSKYSQLSNLVRGSTRKDTQTCSGYFAILFCCTQGFWNYVNHSRACEYPLPAVNVDGSLIHDDLVKGNTFNKYFNSVFTADEDISNL